MDAGFGKGATTPAAQRSRVPIELGVHSPRIERVRELRTSRGRREHRQLAIEGPTLIAEARRSGVIIREIFVLAEKLADFPDLAGLESPVMPVYVVPPRGFGRLSDLETPPGVLAIIDIPPSDGAAILELPGLVLLLAGINDPGNAGTLLRSAEAFGASGALFGAGGVDPYSPKIVRAAMGTLFRLPVATVDAAWLVAAAAKSGRAIVAADMSGADISTFDPGPPIVLAIGNERRGVRDWLPSWDAAVRIAQTGPTESLNAAVAGSILMYLLCRPR